jgi:hypothetical protein
VGAAVEAAAAEAAGEELRLVNMPTQVGVTKKVLQISYYFKNFNCVVDVEKENRSFFKRECQKEIIFNLESISICNDNVSLY